MQCECGAETVERQTVKNKVVVERYAQCRSCGRVEKHRPPSERKEIHCCGCDQTVQARLTNGAEVYSHREDLSDLPFWKCDMCGNFIGCHHKTENRTAPLGCIPSPEIKKARKYIHKILDPLWESGRMKRKDVYAKISEAVGWNYHTAMIRNIEEARKIYRIVRALHAEKVRIPWGSWDTDGRWFHNPKLTMTADEQWAENEKNGFNSPVDTVST